MVEIEEEEMVLVEVLGFLDVSDLEFLEILDLDDS